MGAGEDGQDGALRQMPYEAAAALLRVAWYEAFRSSLARAEKSGTLGAKAPPDAKGSDWHRKQAARASEAWTSLAPKWADAPRGRKEGSEVAQALLEAARAAAEHTAARRVGLSGEHDQGKKIVREAEEEALAAYRRWETALATLEEHKAVLRPSLVETCTAMLWACGWYAANSVERAEVTGEDEEEEAVEFDDGEGEGDQDSSDEDADDEEKFGADYPGASGDPVQDHLAILAAIRCLFWPPVRTWRGARIHLSTDVAAAEAAIEGLAAVVTHSGPFPAGLRSARLVFREALVTDRDPLGPAARAALAKAEALDFWVMLEVPAGGGAKGEEWLRRLAQETAHLRCVRGVALTNPGAPEAAAKLISAVRVGGLDPERCQVSLASPQREVEGEDDAEVDDDDFDGWSKEFKAFHSSNIHSATITPLLKDGNILLEGPIIIPGKEEGGPEDPQGVLDFASHSADMLMDLDLASSWSMTIPDGIKWKSKEGPSREWYIEFGQRLLGAAQNMESGWFFDSWESPGGDTAPLGMRECLARGWLDLSLRDQVLLPTGGKHTHTLIYLHGFQCDGYSYMAEPEYFYRARKAKKAKKKKKKTGKTKADAPEGDDGEYEEFEPYPGLKVVLCSAPLRRITAYGGDEHPAWYDYITDLDGEGEDEYPVEELQDVAVQIHQLLDAEIAAVGAKHVFIGGASQGCGVALHCALTYPGEVGGILGTMGHLLSATEVTEAWAARKVPVFVYHGLADDVIPWEKWAAATYKRLQDAGADVRIVTEEGVDHGDEEREQAWTRAFLTEVLRPASVKTVGKKPEAKKKAPAAAARKK